MSPTNHGAYKGWAIDYDVRRPVTGTWRAERHGVGMCAGTKEALYRMIDTKVAFAPKE